MSRVDAVVFDLDGVLIDSEHVWDEVREDLARERGGRWHDGAQADMMGMSSPEWSRYMHDVIGLREPPEEINDEVVRRMIGRYEMHLPLIDGAVDAVRRLAGSFRLAVASSSNRPLIDAVLVKSGLAAALRGHRLVRGGRARQAGARRLPRSGSSTRARSPERCAAIEDSWNGIRSAHAAGMRVDRVPNRSYPPAADALALADVVVGSLQELSETLVTGDLLR